MEDSRKGGKRSFEVGCRWWSGGRGVIGGKSKGISRQDAKDAKKNGKRVWGVGALGRWFSEFDVKGKISRKGAKTQRRTEESLGWVAWSFGIFFVWFVLFAVRVGF
jgi:hypothetical protein